MTGSLRTSGKILLTNYHTSVDSTVDNSSGLLRKSRRSLGSTYTA
jgi:hypothetical protein